MPIADTNSTMDSNPPAAATAEVFELPLSIAQERFCALDRLVPGNPTWNVPVRFRLEGELDYSLLERALQEIVDRHEILRTTFPAPEGGDEPVQRIAPAQKVSIEVFDLRHLQGGALNQESDRLSTQEARRPFDLAGGPLFRFGLIRIAEQEHILLATFHHAVSDYWSVGILSTELAALCDAHSKGLCSPLPELPIQYGDYAVWQKEQAETKEMQVQQAFWERQLAGMPLLTFPPDYDRPDPNDQSGEITAVILPVELTNRVSALAVSEGTTFFNTMLAALSAVFWRYTGQEDFGIGTQVAGRPNVESETLVGPFINTIVLRPDLSGDPVFRQLLSRTHEMVTRSISNDGVRWERLLQVLRPGQFPHQDGVFRVNFICQRDQVKPQEFAGVKLTAIPSKTQGAIYDLNVFLIQRSSGWRLACEYKTSLFKESTVMRFLEDYRDTMERIVADPGIRLSQLPACSRPVQATREPVPEPSAEETQVPANEVFVMPASLAQQRFWVLDNIAPGNPALNMRACVRLAGRLDPALLRESLQTLADRHESLRTTFEQVEGEIRQVISPEIRLELPVTDLAVARADGQAADAAIRDAVRKESSAPFDLARGPLIRARLFRIDAEDHVFVISTHHIISDGWSHNIIQRDFWTIYDSLVKGVKPDLHPLPIQYGDFVHWQSEWLQSASAGAHMAYWKKALSPPLHILDLPTRQASLAAAADPLESRLLETGLVGSLRLFAQSEGATMFMTTLAAYAVLLHCHSGQEDIVIGSPVANRRPETEDLIGPFAGPVSLRIDLSGNPTLRELLVRVRDTTLDGLSHAELPFEVLLEELKVRSVRGRNPLSQVYFFYQVAFLQPRELGHLTVTPLPDFGLGTHFELQLGLAERKEGVRAQLEYNPELFDAAMMRAFLEDFETVLRLIALNSETRLSDIQVAHRRSTEVEETVSAVRNLSPSDPGSRALLETEAALGRIWQDVLQVGQISPTDNYFDIGGNSLLAVRLFDRIERIMGVKIPLSSLISAPTIREQARLLQPEERAPEWSPLVPIQTGGTRPPFFCIHGAGGNVLIYRDLARLLGPDQPFYGLQSQGLDGKLPPLTTIEEMAALYVREIRRVQPKGPYMVGGYCSGGTVSIEIAQQLQAQGEKVALLALFDTTNWCKLVPRTFWNDSFYHMQKIVFHARSFLMLAPGDQLKFFKAKLAVLRSRITVWRGDLMGDSQASRAEADNNSEAAILARIWALNDIAIVKYQPKPYDGVITDFQPMDNYSRFKDPNASWSKVALKGHEVIKLPVLPATMLVDPFIKHLSEALRKRIDRCVQDFFSQAKA